MTGSISTAGSIALSDFICFVEVEQVPGMQHPYGFPSCCRCMHCAAPAVLFVV